MSFKRDGDDKCALDNQRKRRVADLLYEDIEEDEVTRLSNGKYKCKLCSHQPIFDTLNMFYVHKQGKKHKYSMEYAAQQKQELADLIEKRRHEKLAGVIQAEEDAVTMETISKPTLGMKKPRRPYDRKPVIDYDTSADHKSMSSVSVETTFATHLPGNRLDSASTKKMLKPSYESGRKSSSSDTGRSYSTGQNNSTGETSKGTKVFNMQFKGQAASRQGNDNNVINSRDVHKLVGQSSTELSNKFYLSRKKQRVEASSLFRNTNAGLNGNNHKLSATSPAQTWEFYKDFKGKVPFKMKSSDKAISKVSSEESSDIQRQERVVNGSVGTEGGVGSKEKTERAEKFLNAFGSGWKRDWTGAWVKDEDAEFDSDEEPPDVS